MQQHTISGKRLQKITEIIEQEVSDATQEDVKDLLTTSHEWLGNEHQAWLDNAAVEDIADWLLKEVPRNADGTWERDSDVMLSDKGFVSTPPPTVKLYRRDADGNETLLYSSDD